jgi:serine/threonine protein kinase
MTSGVNERDVEGQIRGTLEAFISGDVALAEAGAKIRSWVLTGSVRPAAVETLLQEAARNGRLTVDAYRRLLMMTRQNGATREASVQSGFTGRSVESARNGGSRAPSSADETISHLPASGIRDSGGAPTAASGRESDTATPLSASSNITQMDDSLDDPHTWTGVWGDEVAVGDVLTRRYRLDQKLGEGGMGMVFLASDIQDKNRQFAVKVLKNDFRRDPAMVGLLEEEVDNGRRLAHPNIVAVYLLMRHHTHLYILMQYLQGKTLEQLLNDDFARGMPWDRAEPVIRGLGAGLAYAHDNGVIHSDIKPANVFITTAGAPKLLDFGIARAVRGMRTVLDSGDMHALTVAYASYEMLDGQKPDVRDDIYSFACVIYELLTGHHPFDGQSAMKADGLGFKIKPVHCLSAVQNRALERALAFRRDDRTDSVEELLAGLSAKTSVLNRRIPWFVSLLSIVLLVPLAGWVIWNQVLKPSADQEIIESLIKPTATRSVDYDPTRVQEDLNMADDDLAKAAYQFDAGLLSEGASNAFDAYWQVLAVDPANRAAAVGIVNILKVYRREVRRLMKEGGTRQALEIARTALRTQAEHKLSPDPELKALAEQLATKLGVAD